MTQLLQGIYAKIERAEEHIENLNTEISEFLRVNPDPYKIVGKLEPDGLNYVFTASGELSAPARFSIIAGEVVHQLRSSFDHLVHALIVQNGGTTTNFNQFPVRTTPQKFKKAREDRLIEGVSGSACNLIESVQPYNTSNAATSTLKIIHDLDITDKHRLLVVIAGAVTLSRASTLTVGSHNTSSHEPIEFDGFVPNDSLPKVTDDGVEVARVRLGTPCPGFYAKAQFTPQIAIETSVGNAQAIDILTKMLKYTIRTVDSFGGEF